MTIVDSKRSGIRVSTLPRDEYERGEPGALRIMQSLHPPLVLVMACPGCGRVGGMDVGNPKPEKSPSWLIEGGSPPDDLSDISLTPSINCVGCCGWHGWLKNGVYQSC